MKMNWWVLCGIFVFGFGLVQGSPSSDDLLPDVIIGDPNEADNDILGEPISEKEFQQSLTIDTEEDMTDDMKEDPLTSSNFFEGDIVVQNKDQLLQMLEGDPNGQLSATNNPRLLWPNGQIPYVISSSYSGQERSLIARAMSEYHQKTCLRFVPRTSHSNYIHILRGQGCSSAVGRAGGRQIVSLGYGCVNFGVIIHELMHAAGFWHEQSRFDRDNYVTIYWNNISPGLQYNFDKNSNAVSTSLGLPYDYASIMHYGQYAFTRYSGSPTIVPKQRGTTIGQRNGFSTLDIKSLNLLYKCSGIVKPEPTEKPEPVPTSCTDSHRFCSSWSSYGYCRSNPGYMLVNCKKSCNACESNSCIDEGRYCGSWSARGECQRNPAFMKLKCKRACGFCGSSNKSCVDMNTYCSDWAKKGECSKNPAYMRSYCKKSCNLC